MANKRFDYTFASVGDLAVRTTTDPKSGRRTASEVLVNDEPIKPTERFWTSLYARFGCNKSLFKYFDYSEVFERISNVESQDRIRLCIERDEAKGESRLLAVSNPTKPFVRHDDLMETLGRYDGSNISYCDGVVESSHVPRAGANSFEISGDAFSNRFIMSTPIDGHGLPNIYLSLLRQICSNGMVGYAKTFRSTLALGRGDDDVIYSIVRALDGFGNDEGYAALRQRFDAASKSWASVYEVNSLYKTLLKLHSRKQIGWDGAATLGGDGIAKLLHSGSPEQSLIGESDEIGSPMLKAFHQMTGDVSQIYGLANVDALSVKRQRSLPVNCTVYDLLNFVSEVATHHADDHGSRASQAWLGTLISGEYDLEDSRDSFDEFQDFFLDRKLDGEVAMDLQKVAV
ncbi:DUF932 domain-containing protein [Symmachiella dynata]|uniref:DUF932 domain-containing protein n=1 Tax=Symmachiella dynata TaxID=2527995 RepID=UPI00119F5B7A|nr:DUF932 domain-containing protein [Symmachiella dynata]